MKIMVADVDQKLSIGGAQTDGQDVGVTLGDGARGGFDLVHLVALSCERAMDGERLAEFLAALERGIGRAGNDPKPLRGQQKAQRQAGEEN